MKDPKVYITDPGRSTATPEELAAFDQKCEGFFTPGAYCDGCGTWLPDR